VERTTYEWFYILLNYFSVDVQYIIQMTINVTFCSVVDEMMMIAAVYDVILAAYNIKTLRCPFRRTLSAKLAQ